MPAEVHVATSETPRAYTDVFTAVTDHVFTLGNPNYHPTQEATHA